MIIEKVNPHIVSFSERILVPHHILIITLHYYNMFKQLLTNLSGHRISLNTSHTNKKNVQQHAFPLRQVLKSSMSYFNKEEIYLVKFLHLNENCIHYWCNLAFFV